MFRILFSLLVVFLQNALVANQGISLAGEYQKNSGLQWDWAIETLERFSFNLHDKVLDVGCGDGKITAMIASQIPQGFVVGMDLSEKMIKQASLNFKQENLLFVQGNADAIPFNLDLAVQDAKAMQDFESESFLMGAEHFQKVTVDRFKSGYCSKNHVDFTSPTVESRFKENFDKVVSFCTLHWVLNQKQALDAMKDCLKPGGIMLLVFPGKAPNNLATLSEKIVNSEKWSKYFPCFKEERVYFTSNEYEELLKKSKLEVLSIRESESETLYSDKHALICWIKPLVNFTDHLEPDLQKIFIEDIADQMLLNNPMASDGSINIRHTKIEVIAIKG